MSDVVRTTGRPMSQALQEAIDGCPTRELAIRAFNEQAEAGGRLSELYSALALELRLAALREQDTMTQLSQQMTAPDPADPPYPAGTKHLTYNPDTDEFTEANE